MSLKNLKTYKAYDKQFDRKVVSALLRILDATAHNLVARNLCTPWFLLLLSLRYLVPHCLLRGL